MPKRDSSEEQAVTPSFAQPHLVGSYHFDVNASFPTDPLLSRFCQLGLELLRHNYSEDQCNANSIVLTSLLPKFCLISPTVYAASAAFGAAYEACPTSRSPRGDCNPLSKIQYQRALAYLRKDLLVLNHGPIPLFLASVLLAGVEVLQRNLTNALKHLQGAFKLYIEFIRCGAQSNPLSNEKQHEDAEQLALGLFAQMLDVQNVSYKLSNSLDLPHTYSDYGMFNHTDMSHRIQQAKSELPFLLHACYSFSSRAATYKYFPHSKIPGDIATEQNQCLALLYDWLSQDDTRYTDLLTMQIESVQTPLGESQPPSLPLRIQCLSAIIYVSSLLSPNEVIFDSLHHIFAQIVDTATRILSKREISQKNQPRFNFRVISTLSQPLFLTAMKCRDPQLRRKAIELLACTGREGPWDAEILVAVAARAVAIEERWMQAQVQEQEQRQGSEMGCMEGDEGKKSVPERARLHGCGMGFISSDSGAPTDSIIQNTSSVNQSRTIEFRFRRCVDIERMLKSQEEDKSSSWDVPKYWEVWDERIEL